MSFSHGTLKFNRSVIIVAKVGKENTDLMKLLSGEGKIKFAVSI